MGKIFHRDQRSADILKLISYSTIDWGGGIHPSVNTISTFSYNVSSSLSIICCFHWWQGWRRQKTKRTWWKIRGSIAGWWLAIGHTNCPFSTGPLWAPVDLSQVQAQENSTGFSSLSCLCYEMLCITHKTSSSSNNASKIPWDVCVAFAFHCWNIDSWDLCVCVFHIFCFYPLYSWEFVL